MFGIYLRRMNFTTLEYLEIRAFGPAAHAPVPVDHTESGHTQVIVPPGAVRTDGTVGTTRPARRPAKSRQGIDALASCLFRACAERVTCLHQESP